MLNNLLINQDGLVTLLVVIPLILVMILLLIATRFKKCPSDKIMVVYGKVSSGKGDQHRSAKCLHGGVSFIVPLFQAYQFMDLTPISIAVDLKSALSRQNIRIDVPSIFTVGISTEPGIMQNAAERLLGLKLNQIQELAKDIIFGQLRLVIATMDIEEINTNRDKFLDAVSLNVEGELKKIGLRLINVNVTDISDESGYIVALGKEAAAKAINDAKISVAEADRNGAIGEANARREQRISVAEADAKAIQGENEAKAAIANSISELRQRQAEAEQRAVSAEKINSAKALEDAYAAEKTAEDARGLREKSTQEADVLVKAQIHKQELELQAEAEAEQIRRRAKGEADAIFAKMEAQAKGVREVLTAQAEGLKEVVKAAGGDTNEATRLMIADKIEKIIETQVEAIKNIKIDKVTVWDSGTNENGKTSTANFISGMMGALPPLNDVFKSAGLEMPSIVAPKKAEEDKPAE
ncbi:MAG: flotillin family protein [Clostridia bacterium]|nr:flotillin family protein [Clostridia bacterium]MBQ6883501.1 flotillin family protein [Clostridia bacterium]